MELELVLIRDGVRTPVAVCKQVQARTGDIGSIHRTPLTPELEALDDDSADLVRTFAAAVKSHAEASHQSIVTPVA